MKKNIVGIALALCAGSEASAQIDSLGRLNPDRSMDDVVARKQDSTSYDYYPESNVYLNKNPGTTGNMTPPLPGG